MMSRLFRTAIVGLGRSDVMILRDAFQAACDAHRFEWVNADDNQIDLLVVNSFFINSSGVQRIIGQQAMPCLIVEHQLKSPSVEDDQLYLPLQEMSSLKQWLNTNLLNNPNSMATQLSEPVPALTGGHTRPVAEKPPVTQKAIVAEAPASHRGSFQASSVQGQHGESSLNQIISRIVDTRLGIWEIVDQHQVVAIADCAQQLIWYNKLPNQSSYQLRLPLTLNKIYQIPTHYVPADLKQWLWQLAWSSESEQSLVHKTLPVQLKAWPQPFGNMPAQALLSACAYLKNKAASAEMLSSHVNISLQDAQRLITALLAVKFAIETKLPVAVAQALTPSVDVPEQEETSFFKGFLSKLRNKLGL